MNPLAQMTSDQRDAIRVAFNAHVRREQDGCLVWTGSVASGGYGRMQMPFAGGQWIALAHRVAWMLGSDESPDGLFVCHHCDNPACVRFDHLFLGSAEENNADMRAKGRSATPPVRSGALHWSHQMPERRVRGERHGHATLTEADVRVIRDRVEAGESQVSIGRSLGVGRGAINAVVKGRTWAHVA